VGEKVEGSHAHHLVLEVGVGAAGKGLVGGERRQSGSVDAGEGAPAVLGMGLRGPEHHLATRKTMERSICAMRGGGGEMAANTRGLDLGSYLYGRRL